MKYVSKPLPKHPEISRELQKISQAFSVVHQHDELHAAPIKPRIGLVVYAGTDWNPGSGEGLYVYKSSGWALLG